MKLREEAKAIVADLEKLIKQKGDNWDYFKSIISIMDELVRHIDKKIYDRKKRTSMVGAAGRVLLDNYSFCESEFGQRIFKFMERFQNLEDRPL